MARKSTTQVEHSSIATVSSQDIAEFDRLKNQMQQLYGEITTLSKKSPDGLVNIFKLTFINEKLEDGNKFLGETLKPSRHFTTFDVDSLPTNSDVVMMLAQYLDALEAWRCARISKDSVYWYWNTDKGPRIQTDSPSGYSRPT